MEQTQCQSQQEEVRECAAFVVLRYPLSAHQRCKNSLIKWLSVHKNYTGKVEGVAERVQVIEGEWPHNLGIALLQFDDVKEAIKWCECTPEIKQQDWLDSMVDRVILPCRRLPPPDYDIVQILEIDFHDYDRFVSDYVGPAGDFLERSGAYGGVVSTGSHKKVRGLWEPKYLVINFWKSAEDFEKSYNSPEYQPLKDTRMCLATTSSCLAELQPLFPQRR